MVAPYDHITVVHEGALLFAYVAATTRDGFWSEQAIVGEIRSALHDAGPSSGLGHKRLADEGITWIRGWHSSESDEGKALLVAWALKLKNETSFDLQASLEGLLMRPVT